jgi:enterochelin esterase-like enzyme
MTLIESYIAAVGDRLRPSRRESVEAELRANILDALEARGGSAAAEEDIVAVLEQLGSPEHVAAAYEPGRTFLVGPALFPALLKAGRIALGVLLGGGVIFYATSLLLGGLADFRAGTLLAQTLAVALRALVVGSVVMVGVFAWLQRADVRVPVAERDAGWNPRSLSPRTPGTRASRADSAIAVVVSAIVLVLLDGVGITARAVGAGPSSIPALAHDVVVAVYALQVATLLTIAAHIGVLIRGRTLSWTQLLRYAGGTVAFVVFTAAPFRLMTYRGALREAGASDNVVNWLIGNAFVVAAIMLVIGVVHIVRAQRHETSGQRTGGATRLGAVVLPIMLVATTGCTTVAATQQGGHAPPQAVAQARTVSPEVHPDGRVTFHLHAPDAGEVALLLETDSAVVMARGDRGDWTHTTTPLSPDLYAYHFVVDGRPAYDRNNPHGAPIVTGGRHSYVHVRGEDAQPWDEQGVPSGSMRRHEYASSRFGETRELLVYTPPGYDAAPEQRYPVLVLLHGVMSDAHSWGTVGRLDVIMNNMIATLRAQPMIVVMPLGYGFADARARAPEMLAPTTDQRAVMNEFAAGLVAEVLPLVEQEYRTREDRRERAIAGFSMGGSQALAIGLNHPDIFGEVASFAGAFIMYGFQYGPWFPDLQGAPAQRVSISVGSEDFLLPVNRHLTAWLHERGVRIDFDVVPGGHSMQVARRELIRLLPELFRSPEASRSTRSRTRPRL